MKYYWKDTLQYKRLMEILEDYWLSDPEEARVEIDLHFERKDGQTQDKYLLWENPELKELKAKERNSSTMLSDKAKAVRNEYYRQYRQKQKETK